ncbi:MAG TPA: hypothetical protein EYG93_11060 [Sulfurospirillum arcachonense]|nr:hypothetical protein [Sulfurospirillum arcachonense]
MKNYLLLLLLTVLFVGCSIKMNPATINQEILPQKNDNTTEFLNSKTYNTYDEKEGKLTTYFFKEKEGELTYTNAITYIPMDSTDQLYGFASQMVFTLNRLTNNRAKTIEEALVMEVKKNDFKKLFNDKEEYIIGNEFSRDLKYSIREFQDMIERQEDSDGGRLGIILPI